MAIAIDDRMVELGANLGWGEVGVTAHESLQEAGKLLLDASAAIGASLHPRLILGNRFHERRSAMRAWQNRQGVGVPV
jgi:hypothetical protein